MDSISLRSTRRLALARAGLLKPEWTDLPSKAAGGGKRALNAALAVIRRFGYLQLDTVSISGARTHSIVLLSRLQGMDSTLGEQLLRPGNPLFEYWGHEASWIPVELYPYFGFRRKEFRSHPWFGDVLTQHKKIAKHILSRLRKEGPMRSSEIGGKNHGGWWNLGAEKKVLLGLWCAGDLAIRERSGFQRIYDLPERVIPREHATKKVPLSQAIEKLLLLSLEGHGFASTSTLAATFRLKKKKKEIESALRRLQEKKSIVPCGLLPEDGSSIRGWIRPDDLELSQRLSRIRPRKDRGVLLSPFDPVLWDRGRVLQLFGFDQTLEIYKPAPQRVYGYYCLPVLAGDRLVGRVDLKADRKKGVLKVLSRHFGGIEKPKKPAPCDQEAMKTALLRFGDGVGLEVSGVGSAQTI